MSHEHDWTASTAPGPIPGMPGSTCADPNCPDKKRPMTDQPAVTPTASCGHTDQQHEVLRGNRHPCMADPLLAVTPTDTSEPHIPGYEHRDRHGNIIEDYHSCGCKPMTYLAARRADAAAPRPAALLREVIEEVESEERRWLEWWARGGKGAFVWKRAAVQKAKEAISGDQQA